MRVRFLKKNGARDFLDLVVEKLNSPSLRGILQFGFDVKYSALKNYYSGARLMPKRLVLEICEVAGIDFEGLEIEEVGDFWGQEKGGEKSRRLF